MNKIHIEEEPAQEALIYILRRMDLRDKYALAIEAAALHTTTSSLASINFVEEPGEELTSARKLLDSLSDKAKILLAIELLSSDLEDEEDDEDEDEDEDEEYDEDDDEEDDNELSGPIEEPDLTKAIAEINSSEARQP